jgi:hypothetical protein
MQNLERDVTVVLQVMGQVNARHPAVAELALKRVALVESLAERRRNVGQEVPPVLRDRPNLYRSTLKS